jgi:hypothetical protein
VLLDRLRDGQKLLDLPARPAFQVSHWHADLPGEFRQPGQLAELE